MPPEARRPIGLISAVPFESARIRAAMKRTSSPREGFMKGSLDGRPCVLVSCGIGLTNAAHAATVMIERFAPSHLVLFGIGGAYHGSGLGVGDLAVATDEVYADLGVIAPGGFMDLSEMGFPLLSAGRKKYYNALPLDKPLVRKARALGRIKAGRFLTVSAVSGTLARATELTRLYGGALCENMEGAAVAHVCAIYGVPVLEIRAISNMVEDRDLGEWDKEGASEAVQLAVMELLRDGSF